MASARSIVTKSLFDFVSKQVGGLELEIHKKLIQTTPVDTGWARGSWTPAIGAPNTKINVPPARKEDRFGPASANLLQNVTKSVRIRSSYKITDGIIWLTSHVPYMGNLNAGSSDKAPARFVEAAILQAINIKSK